MRADEANGQNATDVEEDKTEEISLGGFGEVATRALHLSSGYNQQFRRKGEREGGHNNDLDKCDETTQISLFEVRFGRTPPFPVMESKNASLVR